MNFDACKELVFSIFYKKKNIIEETIDGIFRDRIESGRYFSNKSRLDLSLVDFGKPIAGGKHAKKLLIYSPVLPNEVSVFISNSADGWYTLVNRLCAELKSNCISIVSTEGVNLPANMIRIYENGESVRYVRSMLDGDKWDFFEKGVIQFFEEPSYYKRRKIRDRLDRKIIVDYLRRIGVDIEREEFWSSIEAAFYLQEIICSSSDLI